MRFDEKAKAAPSKASHPVEPKKLVVSYEGAQAVTPKVTPKAAPKAAPGRTFQTPRQDSHRTPPAKKPEKAFNNPFAGLASLKDSIKK
jgi:hypothetical protein